MLLLVRCSSIYVRFSIDANGDCFAFHANRSFLPTAFVYRRISFRTFPIFTV